jgi:2-phospho-L-lactate guanylyltransferase
MTYSALVPVKAVREAKSRLAPYLSSREREQLVMEMLQHVLFTLQESGQFTRINVVSPDERVLAAAQQWGAQSLIEEQPGHNPALQAAAQRELEAGATALLTLSADLPLLQPDDIRSLVQASYHYDVVLAPSHEGSGTNALLVHPPLVVPYVFGTGSLYRYQQEARQRHVSSTTCFSIGLALDIDTISDVETWKYYAEHSGTTPLSAYLTA